MDQDKVIDYVEEPHNDPFVLRDLLYSDEETQSIGDLYLDYTSESGSEKTFAEIKSQLHDLEDMGVVEIDNPDLGRIEEALGRPEMTVDSTYQLTGEAETFFYGKPYTLEWAYNAAQKTNDIQLEDQRGKTQL